MKVTLVTYGTRGDVQPFVALGLALQQAGVEVAVAVNSDHQGFVVGHGLPVTVIGSNLQDVFGAAEVRHWLNSGRSTRVVQAVRQLRAREATTRRQAIHQACQGSDLVVTNQSIQRAAIPIARQLQIPVILTNLFPVWETADFPFLLITTRNLPRLLNRLTYRLRAGRRLLRARGGQSLVGADQLFAATPKLQAYSPWVVPRPADWGEDIQMTGYWTLPPGAAAASPPAALVEWMGEGPPVIFLGFGSMGVNNLVELGWAVEAIARPMGLRAVVAIGDSRAAVTEGPASETLYFVPSVAHEWLFPRCAYVVHHGGAGTTAASLRAGVPTLVCSFICDQPFWGGRVEKMGVGLHLPFKKVTSQTLLRAIQQIARPEIRQRAALFGEKLRAEKGVEKAVEIIVRAAGSGKWQAAGGK
ncbi:MAG: glycosyltransferase [Chloroflexota bacterium]